MNDNKKSSQDLEFDFNNPKSTDKIVDQSMIKPKNASSSDSIKSGAVGLIVFILLGYYFFGGSGKKSVVLEPAAPVLDAITSMPQKPLKEDLVLKASPVPSEPALALKPKNPEEESLKSVPQPRALEEDSRPPVSLPSETKEEIPASVNTPEAMSTAMPSKEQSVPASEAIINSPEPVLPSDSVKLTQSILPPIAGASGINSKLDSTSETQGVEAYTKELQKLFVQQTEKSETIQKNILIELKQTQAAITSRIDQFEKQQGVLLEILKNIAGTVQINEAQFKKIENFINADIAEFAQPLGIIPAPMEPKYVIHAIMPGRAWLRDSQNKITYITEGQTIDGYGSVLTIDPKLGTVILSSGQVLRY